MLFHHEICLLCLCCCQDPDGKPKFGMPGSETGKHPKLDERRKCPFGQGHVLEGSCNDSCMFLLRRSICLVCYIHNIHIFWHVCDCNPLSVPLHRLEEVFLSQVFVVCAVNLFVLCFLWAFPVKKNRLTIELIQEWKETIGRQLREAERETEINKLVQVFHGVPVFVCLRPMFSSMPFLYVEAFYVLCKHLQHVSVWMSCLFLLFAWLGLARSFVCLFVCLFVCFDIMFYSFLFCFYACISGWT